MKSYGYSIIEMAIALVVLGILLTSVLVPLKARFTIEERQNTTELLETARESVSGYAIVNQTVGGYRISDSVHGSNGIIPEGRPYLPCPDITGDGLENRVAMSSDTVMLSAATVADAGSCMQNKGLLPWRTLGLSFQLDSWGRQFGYWVDPAFSSALFGFDETYRANVSEPRLSFVIDAEGIQTYAHRANRHIVGAMVCSQIILAGPEAGCPAVNNQTNLLAGIVFTASIMIGVHNIPAYTSILATATVQGVAEGATFVIYSHGENGWGGMNSENVCLREPLNLRESANAFYAPGHPFIGGDFNCFDTANIPFVTDILSENIFISAPPVNEGINAGDDIIIWSSSNILFGKLLQAGVFPIPGLGFSPRNER